MKTQSGETNNYNKIICQRLKKQKQSDNEVY